MGHPPPPSLFPSSLLFRREQVGGVLVVEVEEVFDAPHFVGKGLRAVALVNGFVERLVRLYEVWWHGERIVEVGEAAVGVLQPGVKHGLCQQSRTKF